MPHSSTSKESGKAESTFQQHMAKSSSVTDGSYGTRGGTNLIFKQNRETPSPLQSVRADRSTVQLHLGEH